MTNPTNPSHPVPPFYRHFFTSLDPLISTLTFLLTYISPPEALATLIPPSHLPYTPSLLPLLHMLGALFLFIALIDGILLRYTHDIGVWKIVQGSVAVVDLLIIYIFFAAVEQQGRGDPGLWGVLDWFNLIITVVCAGTRGAFVLGYGLKSGGAEGGKKRV